MKNETAQKTGAGIVAAAFLLLVCFAAWRVMRPHERHVDVDRSRYPIAGLDLSAHNGCPDFDSIAAGGIAFVYLKASEGENFRDAGFARNYSQARGAGIAVGAYHFFRFDCDGRRQAINLLQTTEGCNFDLPLAIDVEEAGNPANYSTELVTSRLEAMVSHLRASGRNVIIYTNKNGYSRFIRNIYDRSDDDPEVWICSFTDPPMANRPWTIWQHSHKARVPGVKGDVDMNTFNGDSAAWQQWLRRCLPAQ